MKKIYIYIKQATLPALEGQTKIYRRELMNQKFISKFVEILSIETKFVKNSSNSSEDIVDEKLNEYIT